jgi:peptidyl-prolyl cis-trans isomerase B (cyclophilin B)
MTVRRLAPGLLACLVLVAAGCGGVHNPAKTAPREPEKLKPPVAGLDTSKRWTLTFATDRGTFVVTLQPRVSPHATASLVSLARHGYFDNTIFHRIVPGYIIQGGDPTQSGQGDPGYTTVDPPPPSTRYTKGVVAMGKTATEAPGTAGSQFFVMTADASSLAPDYAVVGRVTSGMGIVEKIGELGDPTDPNGTPTEIVVVEHVTAASR